MKPKSQSYAENGDESSVSSDDSESESEETSDSVKPDTAEVPLENEGIPLLTLVDDEESGLLLQQPPSLISECGWGKFIIFV